MQFQFQVAPPGQAAPPDPAKDPALVEMTSLLGQILEAQKEQTKLLRGLVAMHDPMPRWRGFLERWKEQYPDFGPSAKLGLAALERAYVEVMTDLSEQAREWEDDPVAAENEFLLNEFLDRYAARVTQLNNLMNLIMPLAEIAKSEE